MWPDGGTWDRQNIEETRKMLNVKKEEGTGNIKLKRQLRASLMGIWRKYRDMWGIELGRLMRETEEATGVEKLAEKRLALTLRLAWDKRYIAPPYNEKLTMTELPAYCTKKVVEKHVAIYAVISEGKETTVKIVAG